jgi:2-(1,2-epoxy-1,2-dihydrophenyl)acetyl-CoA isomerase
MDEVLLEVEDGVAHVTIDRPGVRNALTVPVVDRLRDVFRSLAVEPVGAMVLRGAQGTFCSGADLAVVRSAFDGDPGEALTPLVAGLHAAIVALRQAPFVTITAVEGYAVGAGMGLALATDLRVCGRSAALVPGYFSIGTSPDGGVSYFLAEAVGIARATSLLVRNAPVTADELLRLGLVESVVADGDVVDAARSLARRVSNTPALALTRTRRLLDAAGGNSLAEHLDEEQRDVTSLWGTADFREGVTAFVERRTPTFEGR